MGSWILLLLAQGNPSLGESSRPWSLTLCSSSLEEVILAEDETDGEQRHPFDGNCSEPGSGVGPRGDGELGPLVRRGFQGMNVQGPDDAKNKHETASGSGGHGDGRSLLPQGISGPQPALSALAMCPTSVLCLHFSHLQNGHDHNNTDITGVFMRTTLILVNRIPRTVPGSGWAPSVFAKFKMLIIISPRIQVTVKDSCLMCQKWG